MTIGFLEKAWQKIDDMTIGFYLIYVVPTDVGISTPHVEAHCAFVSSMRFQHFNSVPTETSHSPAIVSAEISLCPFNLTASAKAAAAKEGGICSEQSDISSAVFAILEARASTMANSTLFRGNLLRGCSI